MYKQEKETYLGILDSMEKLQETIAKTEQGDLRLQCLGGCQKAALSLGTALEAQEEKDLTQQEAYKAIVGRLEEYCELVYQLSEPEQVGEEMLEPLQEIIDEIRSRLDLLKLRFKVVFLPYKASMWDSLESIYLAAKEDERCDAYVCPIPYYEHDLQKDEWNYHYDGALYPEEIPVVDYEKFIISEQKPDLCYVHNPYDNQNYVITVHKDFYAKELKKHVGTLVYVPYYVTAGDMSPEQKTMPVVYSMDYAVLQSQYMKDSCRDTFFYDKILPFGSPKLDRVIRKSREGGQMPPEWKEVIGNRKTLMLNTSVNDLLQHSDKILAKLFSLFELIRKSEKVALIWRPHPLLEATVTAMRPHMVEPYRVLKQWFLDEKIGVLDETADITNTIALSDGYIGSSASSVVNLFGVTGKPIFILNNFMNGSVTEEERRILLINGAAYLRGKLYLTTNTMNGLFSVDLSEKEKKLKWLGRPAEKPVWRSPFSNMAVRDSRLYFGQLYTEDARVYDPVMKRTESLGLIGENRYVYYFILGCTSGSVFYRPTRGYNIMEYQIRKKKWISHEAGVQALWSKSERLDGIPLLNGGAAVPESDHLFYSNGMDNLILKLNQGTDKDELFQIGSEGMQIVLKGESREGLWLIDRRMEQIIFLAPWDDLFVPEKWKTYRMPEDYTWEEGHMNYIGPYGGMWDRGNYMLVFPYKSPHMVKLYKESGKTEYVAEDFWKGSEESRLDYDLHFSNVCCCSVIVDADRILVQRTRDCRMALINVTENTFEEFLPEIPEEEFADLVGKDAGFDKADERGYFCMNESRLFPLENFLKHFAEGGFASIHDRQIEALSTLAANLDGTCGEKTHEYMMKLLEEKAGQEKRKK